MIPANRLDAYQRPPEAIRSLFKKYQKCKADDLHNDTDIIDLSRGVDGLGHQLQPASSASCFGAGHHAFQEFMCYPSDDSGEEKTPPVSAFSVTSIPGLYIVPNLLPREIQLTLLSRLLHRDLSNPNHRTNVHLHHKISYPLASSTLHTSSFFTKDDAFVFPPKNPLVHKPINAAEFLDKKLRWMTLGGQYDWTAKRYPPETPPPFPADIKQLLKSLFPNLDAQAAIVNFYTPGDTLSIHRDVSEYCDQGLVSISIGCEGVFIVGNQDGTQTAIMRLRTGDAVYMTGDSRYAWHGVPKILPNTCPDWLAVWPASDNNEKVYNHWRSWMSNKRINLNVRQMYDTLCTT